jgi:isocitrate dehydrogenase
MVGPAGGELINYRIAVYRIVNQGIDMAYQHVKMPEHGTRISVEHDRLQVPDDPILGYVEGDGIGVDITPACLKVWDAAVEKAYDGSRRVHWAELFLGEKAAGIYDGDYFPDETLEAVKDLKVAIKGPLTTPVGEGFRSLNVSLRQSLDLYACVRPVKYYQGVPSPMKKPDDFDVVIFRENTEDVYSGIEFASGTPENEKLAKFLRDEMGASFFDDAGLGVKPISAFGTKRLVRKAIEYAIENGRESVTLVHKGNIMKFTEGAFRKWGYEVAAEEFGDVTITEDELWDQHDGKRPEGKIVIKDRIADIMFQLLQLRPGEFDVLATMNLNGDYLSDAAAASVGGIGIAPGANMADHVAVFEATHGTAPKYAGQDKVNPSSLLFSGVMMFDYIGWPEVGRLIERAFEKVVVGGTVTYDFARQRDDATEVPTSGFADALVEAIRND